MTEYPKGLPQFKTDKELHQLVQEALDDPRPPMLMDEEEWRQLYKEAVWASSSQKLAS